MPKTKEQRERDKQVRTARVHYLATKRNSKEPVSKVKIGLYHANGATASPADILLLAPFF